MKTCKKILCSLLVVVMCLTSAPLQGFVGIDWPEWSFLAEATDMDWLPEDAIDYSYLTANEYMTRVLLDYDYYGSANNWEKGYGTIQKEQVGYYLNRENISLALKK